MTPVFSQDIIARVKDETDIVEVVKRVVELKAAGTVFKGLCPFHREKTPSFIVTPARQTYHCFGCGEGGDVISFLMETEGLSFPEAVEVLARPLDIDLSSWLKPDEAEGERRSFHRANAAAMELWAEALADARLGSKALEYLNGRGFATKVLRDFDVGYAPSGSEWFEKGLNNAGVDRELAVRAGLLRPSDHGGVFAYFRDRIIFPVKNISRQVAGFGGRVIDRGEPKYLNSSDSPFFSKGRLLYGFESSRMPIAREKSAILVEGYLDLLALVQVGIANVVATCGTAFTPDQARLIRRGAPKVVLVFDGDKAGLKAAVRSADVAVAAGLEPLIVRLPTGEDPASLVIDHGVEDMQQALQGASSYIPFVKGLADEKGGDRELTERALRQVLGTLSRVPDALRREFMLEEAAEIFAKPTRLLKEILAGERQQQQRRSAVAAGAVASRKEKEADDTPARPVTTVPGQNRRGPTVRRSMAQVQVETIEGQLLGCVLTDDSGQAARMFLDQRGDLPLRRPGAEILAAELAAWRQAGDETGEAGASPKEFVTSRWNTAGDGAYRGLVSELLNRQEVAPAADIGKVVGDCLVRLRQDLKSRRNS